MGASVGPGVRVIPVSRIKAFLLLLGAIGFVVLGVWMAGEKPLLGWLCAGFFALGIPAGLAMLFTDTLSLRLDAEALEFGSPLRKTRIRWQDIAGFEPAQISGARMIAIVYRDHYAGQRLGRAVASELSGVEGAIPNHYTLSLTDLLAELRAWHARHGMPGA